MIPRYSMAGPWLAATLGIAAPGIAVAATPAGTRIVNVARLATADAAIDSNTVTLAVDEIVDVTVAAAVPTLAVAPDQAIVPVGFVVTDTGNADEAYRLIARSDDAGVAIAGIASDDDGDGAYDAATDATLPDASVALKSGAARRVFVLVRDPARAGHPVRITLTANAATGHGAPGTVFAGAGTGGVDAIVGATGASARAATMLTPGSARPALEKSQSVKAPDGSARVMPGSIVTYVLVAHFPRATASAVVSDAIPDGTAYVASSLTLDGEPLTDAGDGDAGAFDGTAIRVTLGDITAAGTRNIRFQTVIR